MTPTEAINFVETASSSAFFGANPRDSYRKWARLCHPDKVESSLAVRATKAFARLEELYSALTASVRIQMGEWSVGSPQAKGDICDLYNAKKGADSYILKIARDAQDNDLLAAEAAALRTLWARSPKEGEFLRYIPQLAGSLQASGRQANVLSVADPQSYTLADLKAIFPAGIDFRHVVWMGNRLLSALGFAHGKGIVHGAVLPEHLLFGPESHGLMLVDWCYSVKIGDSLKARVKARADHYPPEVARKRPAVPATDIYMAVRALLKLAPIPKRFIPLFDYCLAESPGARPQDAWDLQDEWRKLANDEFGEPKYLKLEIPIT